MSHMGRNDEEPIETGEGRRRISKPIKLNPVTVKAFNGLLKTGTPINAIMDQLGYAPNVIYPALKRSDLVVVSFIMAQSKVEKIKPEYTALFDHLKGLLDGGNNL